MPPALDALIMRPTNSLLLAIVAGAGAACAAGGGAQSSSRVVPPSASATMINADGKSIGTASVINSKFGGLLVLKLDGLPPGPHGLHIHAGATCEPPAFASAGPHLNPGGKQHGLENPAGHHAGDLPNIMVHADGSVDTSLALSGDLLTPGAIGSGNSARTLVIHAQPDDMRSDPAGNSGARIACGVLQR